MNASRFLTSISPVECVVAAMAVPVTSTSTPSRRCVSGLLVPYMPLARIDCKKQAEPLRAYTRANTCSNVCCDRYRSARKLLSIAAHRCASASHSERESKAL